MAEVRVETYLSDTRRYDELLDHVAAAPQGLLHCFTFLSFPEID